MTERERLSDEKLRELFNATNTSEPLVEGWLGLERFARAVEQAALSRPGMVWVPVEPTEKMIAAGDAACAKEFGITTGNEFLANEFALHAETAYRAMIAASQIERGEK